MSPEERIIERLSAENGKLHTRIEMLEYKLSNLVGREGTSERLGLTRMEFRLAHLMAVSSPLVVTKDALLAARRPETELNPDGVHIKIVDVFVCKIRKKLAQHGIDVHTAWGAGYYMDQPDAQQFLGLVYGKNQMELAA